MPRGHIGCWSSEELEKLRHLVRIHGRQWKLIADIMGTKTQHQVRGHYINYGDPNLVIGPLTKKEKDFIEFHRKEYTPKEISDFLNRSINKVSGYLYNKYIRVRKKVPFKNILEEIVDSGSIVNLLEEEKY